MAEDMWNEYTASGQYVEVITPFQRAQRRAHAGAVNSATHGTQAEAPAVGSGAAGDPIIL